MELVDEQQTTKPHTLSCFNCQSINDENNNFKNFTCSNCQCKNRLEEKEGERMIIVPDTSSDDDYWCSSCSSLNDSELISFDTRTLWHDIAHMIKCVYRETNREFTENHSSDDLCKAKNYVQILTQLNPESLFNKIESIVLEYVDEIRNQVLKRFQTCLKTSNDVQLFISYLLDEYNIFIQAAKNVSTIVSYLEENYMKSFHLTWLLYNKHLYEKLVYMDKKIQHSMSTMIDLLQPSNVNDDNDYSPAEYTKLLNRFLAFDEEMSEIACLYKDCQTKMISISRNSSNRHRNQMGIIVKTKTKKICKKTKKHKNIQGLTQENFNSSMTTAVNIPSVNNASSTSITPQQGSNGSSISSGVCAGKESSSISSFDEYLLDNNTSSSSYTKEEPDNLIHDEKDLHEQLLHDIINTISPITQIQGEIDELILNENPSIPVSEEKQKAVISEPITNNKEQTTNVASSKKSKSSKSSSSRRKESSITILNNSSSIPKKTLTPDLIVPPKPPSSSTGSKFQADFRPLTYPLLSKNENSSCPPFLSAKIQSVSFTAGTFGSITTDESSHSSFNNTKRLNINLKQRPGPFCTSMKSNSTSSSHAYDNLDQLLRQAGSTNEISTLLSSSSSKTTDEFLSQKSFLNDKNCDFCCCDLFHEHDASTTNAPIAGCVTCMSLPGTTTITCGFNQRDVEMKERLKLKLTKRTVQNLTDQQKSSPKNKSKIKPLDNNIDDLVRFIDGNETIVSDEHETGTKKNKKKKNKSKNAQPTVPALSKDPVVETPQPLSKRKQKAKLKLEQEQKQAEESSSATILPTTPQASPEKTSTVQIKVESPSENIISPEEEVNWITISRKQTKHKSTPPPPPSAVPSLLAAPILPIIPSKNTKQKRQQQPTVINPKKTISSNTQIPAQQKVILPTVTPETIPVSNKQQQNTIVYPSSSSRVQNQSSHQQQKVETPSCWTLNTTPVASASTLLATTPAFVPSNTPLVIPNESSSSILLEESSSSLYWNSNGYLHPSLSSSSQSTLVPSITPGPVQRPISSFSPALGSLNPTTSRCIQRPSSEPRTTSFPLYSPMNYAGSSSNSTWDDTPITNSNEPQWTYPQTSTIVNDFPLYDPFNSGADLNIPLTNGFEEHSDDQCNNDIDEMDAFDKEIEDFKKFCFENVPPRNT